MNIKKYQVFISSTYSDLIEERKKALDILLMADCIPAGMEAFVATDLEQFEVIKKVIDLCDYYILIIGKRYGSISPVTGISYTEMEYEYAIKQNIPVLVFALDESVILTEEKTETDPGKQVKLKSFRDKALTNRMASIWRTSDELNGQLAISIMKAIKEIERPGWQRGTDYDEASLRREIMESHAKISELSSELEEAKKQVANLTKQEDLAFENCDIEIAFHYTVTTNNSRSINHRNENRKITARLDEIFTIIATELMNVSKTENGIETALKSNLRFGVRHTVYFDDDQLVKKLLNQFRALGLMQSSWSEENKKLYWGLTAKGEKIRDEAILIRIKEKQ